MSDSANEELLPPAIDETPPTEAPAPPPPPLVIPLQEPSVSTPSPSASILVQPQLPVELTFPARLQTALNAPYTVNMRRSVQTCVLLEADRCLRMQYKRLKAFQRKVALHDTAADIIDTLDFIPPHYRLEIMYRTATSKVILSPDLTWRRMKLIDREIRKTIIPKIVQIDAVGKTHEQVCNAYLQREYEKVSGKKDPYHPNWEYSHDNHFTAYRMFYLGADVNPNLPPAIDPNPERVVPSQKPRPECVEAENLKRVAKTTAVAAQAAKEMSAAHSLSLKRRRTAVVAGSRSILSVTPMQAAEADDAAERRALLKEIKDHLDILNEFKGIIPESELVDRKRQLFALLPKP